MPDLTLDDDRATGAWVAPLLSTLLTLPACLLAYVVGGLSVMACDSCAGPEADRFESSFGIAFPVLLGGLGIALFLLAAGWALPWERRNSARRVALALAAPLMVASVYVLFTVLVDWP
jgi:NhaP-type Na+/H+ or K+/H+ antiporter